MACETVNLNVVVSCVNGCGKALEAGETYICQSCSDDIDRRANEVLGNAEDDDG